MEEIFIGQEWAKFLPPSTSSQPVSSYITQGMGLTSSISQTCQNEQIMLSQWNYREATDPQLQTFHNTDTTEYMFNKRKASCFGMPPTSELHKGQYGMSDSRSNNLERMDLSVSTLGNNRPNKEQVHIYPYNQTNPVEPSVNPSLSSEQSVNHSQATEINNNQPESMHEVLHIVDLSYLQVGKVTGRSIFI